MTPIEMRAEIERLRQRNAELLEIVKDIYAGENDVTRRKHSDAMRFRMEDAISRACGARQ